MSLAWYVVLERLIPGHEHFVCGKALAHAGKALDALAERSGVEPLMNFFSAGLEEYSAIADSEGPRPERFPPESWFSASDGLKTVSALAQAAENEGFDRRVVEDLRELRRILAVANEHGIRWHLAIDL